MCITWLFLPFRIGQKLADEVGLEFEREETVLIGQPHFVVFRKEQHGGMRQSHAHPHHTLLAGDGPKLLRPLPY